MQNLLVGHFNVLTTYSRLPNQTGSLLVKNSEYLHDFALIDKPNSEREAMHEHAANVEKDRRVRKRAVCCPFYCRVELEQELDA